MEIEYQSSSIHLLIRTLAGVVLVLIVGIELEMFAQREYAARVDCGCAQFTDTETRHVFSRNWKGIISAEEEQAYPAKTTQPLRDIASAIALMWSNSDRD